MQKNSPSCPFCHGSPVVGSGRELVSPPLMDIGQQLSAILAKLDAYKAEILEKMDAQRDE